MTKEELKNRTKKFAIDVIRLVRDLPESKESKVISYQLIKSSTSVAANYRAACRSRSQAEFISKINIVEEEADESAYWLEIIIETGLMKGERVEKLLKEANELTAIFTASGRTAKNNKYGNQVAEEEVEYGFSPQSAIHNSQ